MRNDESLLKREHASKRAARKRYVKTYRYIFRNETGALPHLALQF
jgi:hypothetical protein